MAASTIVFNNIEFSQVEEIVKPLVDKSIIKQVEAITKDIVVSDIDTTKVGILGCIVTLTIATFKKSSIVSAKTIQSLIEFIWGILIYGIVVTGVYFTYELFST